MRRLLLVPLSAALLTIPAAPITARVGDFAIINATGMDIAELSIRPFASGSWQPLSVTRRAGNSWSVAFSSEDHCAFDIRATLAGGATATWSGVNLCEAKAVTLNRTAAGAVWVDYD